MQKDLTTVIRQKFRKLLRDDIDVDVENTPIAELGIDSLDFFDLLTQLEDEHGIHVGIDSLDEKMTLQDLLQAIKAATT